MVTSGARPAGDDRREFYRINDAIGVDCERLNAEQAAERIATYKASSSVWSQTFLVLQQLETDRNLVDRSIIEESPRLAHYLDSLTQRVDLLTQLVLESRRTHQRVKTTPVEISANGIRFPFEGEVAEGDVVALTVTLMPERVPLELVGVVVRVDHVAPLGRQVAAQFEALKDEDREVLIRHILRAEGRARNAEIEEHTAAPDH